MKRFVMRQLRRTVRTGMRLAQLKEAPRPTLPAPPTVPLDSIHAARLLFFDDLITKTQDVPGDIVECGVGDGTSMLLMAQVVQVHQLRRLLWGFDSFEGLPQPTAEDGAYHADWKGELAWSQYDVECLLRAGLNDDLFFRSNISLVKGFFEDTLGFHQGPISLLNLDVDLYQSYKTCLEVLYPKVSPGGIVAFDEYRREAAHWPGAAQAIDEFFADKDVEFIKAEIYGKFYVVKPGLTSAVR